jgi:molecular chaperone GrpE
MTDKDDEFRPDEEGPADSAGPDSQEEADASDQTAEPELTVDDILRQAQEPGARNADALEEDARLADLESTLLNDLKRLQAEYANYRRRTEEQRERDVERAKGSVAAGLLPVLDDLDRAEQHGDLVDGSAFTVIAEKIRGVAERLGMVTYGAAGEVFDPQHHEAIFQQPVPDVSEPTILEVVEIGYRLGDIELRPAKVVVAVPAPSTDSGSDSTGSGNGSAGSGNG